jgi:hypothetical protein
VGLRALVSIVMPGSMTFIHRAFDNLFAGIANIVALA